MWEDWTNVSIQDRSFRPDQTEIFRIFQDLRLNQMRFLANFISNNPMEGLNRSINSGSLLDQTIWQFFQGFFRIFQDLSPHQMHFLAISFNDSKGDWTSLYNQDHFFDLTTRQFFQGFFRICQDLGPHIFLQFFSMIQKGIGPVCIFRIATFH